MKKFLIPILNYFERIEDFFTECGDKIFEKYIDNRIRSFIISHVIDTDNDTFVLLCSSPWDFEFCYQHNMFVRPKVQNCLVNFRPRVQIISVNSIASEQNISLYEALYIVIKNISRKSTIIFISPSELPNEPGKLERILSRFLKRKKLIHVEQTQGASLQTSSKYCKVGTTTEDCEKLFSHLGLW